MPRGADQFRQSDVTLWGLVTLMAAGVALLGANVSGLLPNSFFAGLHSSRATDWLGAQVVGSGESSIALAGLAGDEQQLRIANAQLARRIDDLVKSAGATNQRVSALEGAKPRTVKTIPFPAQVDSSLLTGSIGTPEQGFSPAMPPSSGHSNPKGATSPLPQTQGADAGQAPAAEEHSATSAGRPMPRELALTDPSQDVPVNTTPTPTPAINSLARASDASIGAATSPAPVAPSGAAAVPLPLRRPDADPSPATAGPAPAASPANVKAIGIAIGKPVAATGALSAWQALAAKVGVELVGTSPLLADDPAGSKGKVLVAGPIAGIAAATALCADIDRQGISCTPMPYVGTELAAGARQPAGESFQ